jgi:ATP phosphoribosyltransferase regulatory subunit HisZ
VATVSGDAVTMIEAAVRSFLDEVPQLAPMKLVAQVDFIGRGDVQQFRVELPDVTVTRGAAHDAKVNLEMRRDFFNAMVEHDAKVADWREAFTYGKAKATGVQQYLRLIENVVDKAEERARLRRAHG